MIINSGNPDFKYRVIKKILLLFLPMLLLVSCLVFLKYRSERNCKLRFFANLQSQHLHRAEKNIHNSMEGVLSDIVFISGLDRQEERSYHGRYPVPGIGDILRGFFQSRKNYDRITLLGVHGERKLMVEYNDGSPVLFTENVLDDIYGPDNSEEKATLKDNEISISVLKPENTGQFERPSKRVIRLGMNYQDHTGNFKGMIVVDYILDAVRIMLEPFPGIPGFEVSLLDSQGRKLGPAKKEAPVEEVIAGEGPAGLSEVDYEASRIFKKTREGKLYSQKGLYSFLSVDPDFRLTGGYDSPGKKVIFKGASSPPWKLVSFVPRHYIDEKILVLKRSNLFIFFSVSLLLLFASSVLAFAYEKREKEALVDPLTSLWNRRFFLEKIDKLQQELNGGKTRACMVLIDLGNFKDINDKFGHKTGDTVLKKVGYIIRENLRINDEVARYGGDEFVIFLPRTDKNEALMILDRVRKKISHINLSQRGIDLEADYGIGEYPVDSRDLMEIIDIADARMYERKKKRKEMKHETLKLGYELME